MAYPARQLDLRIEIVTPENIAFEYQVAGPFRRLPAYLIDIAIRLVVFVVVGLVLTIGLGVVLRSGGTVVGIMCVLWFLLSWFYGGLFEALWNGQTPGKHLLGLRVLTAEGQPITGLQAILRNVLRAVDCMPLVPIPGAESLMPVLPMYMLGLVACSMNHRYQRLGDLAVGTMVVVEARQRLRGVVKIDQPAAIELAHDLPPGFTAPPTLAKALSLYAERRPQFSPARRLEIARTLGEPLAERFALSGDINYDTLLLALYYRTFVSDRGGDQPAERAGKRPVAAAIAAVAADEPTGPVWR